MAHPLAVLVFAGPLLGLGLPAGAAPAVVAKERPVPAAARVAELRARDTDKVNLITAGEEQKSSYGRCSEAADAELCRILVSAVNVAAIIGSSVTGSVGK